MLLRLGVVARLDDKVGLGESRLNVAPDYLSLGDEVSRRMRFVNERAAFQEGFLGGQHGG